MLSMNYNITFDAPIEDVWALLTDYPGYARFPKIKWARVVQPGTDHPAGVGAVRELCVDGITFVERIEAFEPPHLLAYKITSSRPIPLDHDIGRMRLTDLGDGRTQLDWSTTFAVGIPIIGGPLTYIVRALMNRTFGEILQFVKTEVEQRARAAA